MSSLRQTNENNNTVINEKLHSALETSSTCANERLDDKEGIRNWKHLNSTTNPYEEASFFSRVRTNALKFLPFTFEKKVSNKYANGNHILASCFFFVFFFSIFKKINRVIISYFSFGHMDY